MDDALVGSITLPGLRPARQQRSRAVLLRLVEAALAMLQTRDFEALSVAELCQAVDVTVGSFYTRFDSKEVFLELVQRLVVEDGRRRMAAALVPERHAGRSLEQFLEYLLRGAVAWYRRYEGLIRASLRRAQHDPAAWAPLRENGRLQVELALPIILALAGRKGDRRTAEAVEFAFQLAYGTLNNMMLVDPGPYRLHNPATPRRLAQAMLLVIENPA
jgi:AcrR family transcriptional regulator